MKLKDNSDGKRAKATWWQFCRTSPGLNKAIAQCDRVLVCSIVSKHLAFVLLPSNFVFAHRLAIFPFDHFPGVCILQSRIHEVFAYFFSSTLEDRINYSPTDCFETFPFPENWESNPTLESIGKTYYEFRADLMVRNNQGLTDTYNRFHDPAERDLHAQMDCNKPGLYACLNLA